MALDVPWNRRPGMALPLLIPLLKYLPAHRKTAYDMLRIPAALPDTVRMLPDKSLLHVPPVSFLYQEAALIL